ncbi:hypothetical protein [Sedimenticola sp.]|uniref:hypothetical protein n=1 Tax=Sedimenticola sp. TaxID=1940285 RepID=UPI003D152A48
MKHLLFALSAYALSSFTFAGEATISNTFSSGQPALAADVNQNFTDVKTAVDDNDSRITTLEGVVPGKQARVTGTCGAEQSINAINPDGTVTCEVDNNSGGTVTSVGAGGGLASGGTLSDPVISRAGGSVSISHMAFAIVNPASTCSIRLNSALNFAAMTAGAAAGTCQMFASVNLPDQATVTDFSCRVNAGVGGTSRALLIRADDSFRLAMGLTSNAADGGGNQTLSDTDGFINAPAVDNANFTYAIQIDSFPSESFSVYRCTISYTF